MYFMNRIQFFPSENLANILNSEAASKGVSVSRLVNDLLEEHFGIASKSNPSITQLTGIVLKEVEEYLKQVKTNITFDLNVSSTYRTISMVNGQKPSTIRASIGRSFKSKIGKAGPFKNVRKCIINGKQQLSANNALVYETF